jgi:hypothetical protein
MHTQKQKKFSLNWTMVAPPPPPLVAEKYNSTAKFEAYINICTYSVEHYAYRHFQTHSHSMKVDYSSM